MDARNRQEARDRGLRLALEAAARHTDPESGLVRSTPASAISERETVYAALAFLISGDVARGRELLAKLGPIHGHFSLCALLLAEQRVPHLLDEATRAQLHDGLRACLDESAEDIIAGRNINLPLQTWTLRLAAGLCHERPDRVDEAVRALEDLTGLVRAHGSLPEFNSPVYHVITLECTEIIAGLGEPRSTPLADRLRRYLWNDLAWHYHPRLRVMCGPWGRQYQDGFDGGGANAEFLMDQVWGAFYDEHLAYLYDHAHDFMGAPILGLYADHAPERASEIALSKPLPITVCSRAEQVDFQLGDEWAPGGIAELTTWMDANRALGTASRGHVHGMQSATCVAHWTRTGEPVSRLDDLGLAYTHFVQNGRRPGIPHDYRMHHHGRTLHAGKYLWAEDGRAAVLQSGPTALVVYTPKPQERAWVKGLEALLVVPRPESVDAVLVDGAPIDRTTRDADPTASLVVRSGKAALGLRFAPCDEALTAPRLRIEWGERHLFVGLRLVDFGSERELPLATYRRYGASIGLELRWTPQDDDVARLVEDLRRATLTDEWWMGAPPGDFGGPRKVSFEIAGKTLRGRYAPVAECWLHRDLPDPEGPVKRLTGNP